MVLFIVATSLINVDAFLEVQKDKQINYLDIEYIEICSNEDTGSGPRSVFNYRVVMHSAGVAMDMRGRCSAGQKVRSIVVIVYRWAQLRIRVMITQIWGTVGHCSDFFLFATNFCWRTIMCLFFK